MAILGQGAPQAGPQTNQAGKADCSDFTREILYWNLFQQRFSGVCFSRMFFTMVPFREYEEALNTRGNIAVDKRHQKGRTVHILSVSDWNHPCKAYPNYGYGGQPMPMSSHGQPPPMPASQSNMPPHMASAGILMPQVHCQWALRLSVHLCITSLRKKATRLEFSWCLEIAVSRRLDGVACIFLCVDSTLGSSHAATWRLVFFLFIPERYVKIERSLWLDWLSCANLYSQVEMHLKWQVLSLTFDQKAFSLFQLCF